MNLGMFDLETVMLVVGRILRIVGDAHNPIFAAIMNRTRINFHISKTGIDRC